MEWLRGRRDCCVQQIRAVFIAAGSGVCNTFTRNVMTHSESSAAAATRIHWNPVEFKFSNHEQKKRFNIHNYWIYRAPVPGKRFPRCGKQCG